MHWWPCIRLARPSLPSLQREMGTQIGSMGALRALYSRAPLWRFFLMLASLASMLFVFYPPDPIGRNNKPVSPANDVATYSRQHAQLAPVLPTASQAGHAVAANPPPAIAVKMASAAAAADAAGIRTPATKDAPAAPSPKMADLSLATVGATSSADNSGINAALMGRSYSGSIHVDGYKIPLPSGNWVSLANTSIKLPTANGLGFFLGKIEHKRLVAVVKGYVLRSKDKPGAGFEEVKGCTGNDPTRNFALVEEAVAFGNQACWRIHSYFTPPLLKWADRSEKIDPLDRAAAGDMQAKGVTYAQDLVDVRFSRFTTWGGMEVHYMFSPEEEGISSNAALSYVDMDWRANNIVRYPEKVAYVQKLEKWGTAFWPQFKAGFAEGQRADDVSSAPPATATAPTNAVATKAPAPPIDVVSKVVFSGKQQILLGHISVKPDCTSAGLANVRVVEAPKHGKVTFVEETGSSNFPKENPRNACNGLKLPVLNAKYQSDADYVGNDMVKVDVIFPDGAYRTEVINISVK